MKPEGLGEPSRNGARAQEIARLYDAGVAAAEIALQMECSIWSVYKALRKAGVRRQSASANLDPDTVRELYASGMTLAQVAQTLKCSSSMVYGLMRRARIPRRGRGRPLGRVTNPARDRAMAGMRENGATLQEIGSVFGVTRERVRQILSGMGHTGAPTPSSVRRRKAHRRGLTPPPRELLNYLIREESLPLDQVARRLGSTIAAVRNWMTEMRIEPTRGGRQ